MLDFKRRVVTLGALLLAASISVPAAAQGTPSRTVTVALSGGQNTLFAPFLVAAGSGLFEKRGIKVEQQSFPSGAASFAAFSGGSMPLCVCPPTMVMAAASTGRDVVAIFDLSHGAAMVFSAHKKHEKDRGTDLAKFDGLTWAYTAEGAPSQIFMMRAAQSANLKWENQKRVAVGGVDAYLPALRAERADIITLDPMSAARAIAQNLAYPVFNTNDPAQLAPAFGLQLGLPMVTTRAWLTANPQLAQDFVDAMREGMVMIQERINDPQAILRMMPQEFQQAYSADFPVQWGLVKTAFVGVDGVFPAKALTDTASLARTTGVLKGDSDASRPFENRLAQSAVTRIPSRPAR